MERCAPSNYKQNQNFLPVKFVCLAFVRDGAVFVATVRAVSLYPSIRTVAWRKSCLLDGDTASLSGFTSLFTFFFADLNQETCDSS